MYAIIESCGKQYKVAEGDVVFFEKLDAEEGKKPEAEWQFRYGTYLAQRRDPVFQNFLDKEKNTFERILENPQFASANREDREEIVGKIREIEACLASMKEG